MADRCKLLGLAVADFFIVGVCGRLDGRLLVRGEPTGLSLPTMFLSMIDISYLGPRRWLVYIYVWVSHVYLLLNPETPNPAKKVLIVSNA